MISRLNSCFSELEFLRIPNKTTQDLSNLIPLLLQSLEAEEQESISATVKPKHAEKILNIMFSLIESQEWMLCRTAWGIYNLLSDALDAGNDKEWSDSSMSVFLLVLEHVSQLPVQLDTLFAVFLRDVGFCVHAMIHAALHIPEDIFNAHRVKVLCSPDMEGSVPRIWKLCAALLRLAAVQLPPEPHSKSDFTAYSLASYYLIRAARCSAESLCLLNTFLSQARTEEYADRTQVKHLQNALANGEFFSNEMVGLTRAMLRCPDTILQITIGEILWRVWRRVDWGKDLPPCVKEFQSRWTEGVAQLKAIPAELFEESFKSALSPWNSSKNHFSLASGIPCNVKIYNKSTGEVILDTIGGNAELGPFSLAFDKDLITDDDEGVFFDIPYWACIKSPSSCCNSSVELIVSSDDVPDISITWTGVTLIGQFEETFELAFLIEGSERVALFLHSNLYSQLFIDTAAPSDSNPKSSIATSKDSRESSWLSSQAVFQKRSPGYALNEKGGDFEGPSKGILKSSMASTKMLSNLERPLNYEVDIDQNMLPTPCIPTKRVSFASTKGHLEFEAGVSAISHLAVQNIQVLSAFDENAATTEKLDATHNPIVKVSATNKLLNTSKNGAVSAVEQDAQHCINDYPLEHETKRGHENQKTRENAAEKNPIQQEPLVIQDTLLLQKKDLSEIGKPPHVSTFASPVMGSQKQREGDNCEIPAIRLPKSKTKPRKQARNTRLRNPDASKPKAAGDEQVKEPLCRSGKNITRKQSIPSYGHFGDSAVLSENVMSAEAGTASKTGDVLTDKSIRICAQPLPAARVGDEMKDSNSDNKGIKTTSLIPEALQRSSTTDKDTNKGSSESNINNRLDIHPPDEFSTKVQKALGTNKEKSMKPRKRTPRKSPENTNLYASDSELSSRTEPKTRGINLLKRHPLLIRREQAESAMEARMNDQISAPKSRKNQVSPKLLQSMTISPKSKPSVKARRCSDTKIAACEEQKRIESTDNVIPTPVTLCNQPDIGESGLALQQSLLKRRKIGSTQEDQGEGMNTLSHISSRSSPVKGSKKPRAGDDCDILASSLLKSKARNENDATVVSKTQPTTKPAEFQLKNTREDLTTESVSSDKKKGVVPVTLPLSKSVSPKNKTTKPSGCLTSKTALCEDKKPKGSTEITPRGQPEIGNATAERQKSFVKRRSKSDRSKQENLIETVEEISTPRSPIVDSKGRLPGVCETETVELGTGQIANADGTTVLAKTRQKTKPLTPQLSGRKSSHHDWTKASRACDTTNDETCTTATTRKRPSTKSLGVHLAEETTATGKRVVRKVKKSRVDASSPIYTPQKRSAEDYETESVKPKKKLRNEHSKRDSTGTTKRLTPQPIRAQDGFTAAATNEHPSSNTPGGRPPERTRTARKRVARHHEETSSKSLQTGAFTFGRPLDIEVEPIVFRTETDTPLSKKFKGERQKSRFHRTATFSHGSSLDSRIFPSPWTCQSPLSLRDKMCLLLEKNSDINNEILDDFNHNDSSRWIGDAQLSPCTESGKQTTPKAKTKGQSGQRKGVRFSTSCIENGFQFEPIVFGEQKAAMQSDMKDMMESQFRLEKIDDDDNIIFLILDIVRAFKTKRNRGSSETQAAVDQVKKEIKQSARRLSEELKNKQSLINEEYQGSMKKLNENANSVVEKLTQAVSVILTSLKNDFHRLNEFTSTETTTVVDQLNKPYDEELRAFRASITESLATLEAQIMGGGSKTTKPFLKDATLKLTELLAEFD